MVADRQRSEKKEKKNTSYGKKKKKNVEHIFSGTKESCIVNGKKHTFPTPKNVLFMALLFMATKNLTAQKTNRRRHLNLLRQSWCFVQQKPKKSQFVRWKRKKTVFRSQNRASKTHRGIIIIITTCR